MHLIKDILDHSMAESHQKNVVLNTLIRRYQRISKLTTVFLNTVKLQGLFEPPHDKTNKMTVRPAKTQISLGIRPVRSVFAVRMKKAWVLSYPLSAE